MDLSFALGLSAARASGAQSFGLSPASFTAAGLDAPTVCIDPNLSTITYAGDDTFNGYISGTSLVVTSNTTVPISEGDTIIYGASSFRIMGTPTDDNVNMTGTFTLDTSATIGSSGSQVTFTLPNSRITQIDDLAGNAHLSTANSRVRVYLKTDGDGRKYLLVLPWDTTSAMDGWLRNLSIGSIDTFNQTTFMAVGVLSSVASGTLLSDGAYELAATSATARTLGLSAAGSAIYPDAYGLNAIAAANPANANQLVVGAQVQVLGNSCTTADGVNGSGTGNGSMRLYTNGNVYASSVVNGYRRKNTTGFECFKSSQYAATSFNAGYTSVRLYGLYRWLTGQLGTNSTTAASKADAINAFIRTHVNIPDITHNVVLGVDSRTQLSLKTGISPATLLADRGQAWSLPKTCRVTNVAISGHGAGLLSALLQQPQSALATANMLGSGKDILYVQTGFNDALASSSMWPGNVGSDNSTARADDVFEGTAYKAVPISATQSTNSNSLSVASVSSGYLARWATLSAGLPGNYISQVTNGGAGTYTTGLYSASYTISGSLTANLLPLRESFDLALTRGFKVVVAGETIATTNQTFCNRLRTRILDGDLATYVGANSTNLRTTDLRLIQVGGLKVFGSDYSAPNNYLNTLHYRSAGMEKIITGGDTAQYGILSNITAFIE